MRNNDNKIKNIKTLRAWLTHRHSLFHLHHCHYNCNYKLVCGFLRSVSVFPLCSVIVCVLRSSQLVLWCDKLERKFQRTRRIMMKIWCCLLNLLMMWRIWYKMVQSTSEETVIHLSKGIPSGFCLSFFFRISCLRQRFCYEKNLKLVRKCLMSTSLTR